MSNSLSVFMSLAITALILSVLVVGLVYQSLTDKNTEQQNVLRDEYNLQMK